MRGKIVRPDEGLFFANADALRDEITTLVDETQPPVKVVLLDLEMSNQLDVPSVDMLVEFKEELGRREATLWLARLHQPVRETLERSGVVQEIGPDNIHSRVLESLLDEAGVAEKEKPRAIDFASSVPVLIQVFPLIPIR